MTNPADYKPLKILLVDDDKNIRTTLSLSLSLFHHDVTMASSVGQAIEILSKNQFDMVLTDYRMEDATGLDLTIHIKEHNLDTIVVVMTAYASYENAVTVVREGAFDYLPKPFTKDQLKHLLNKVQKLVILKQENIELKRQGMAMANYRNQYFEGLASHAMKHLEDFVVKLAPTDATILILGESGTGKSHLAKQFHDLSSRMERPFVEVHCTNLPDTLIESELFGHVKGSFTGAIKDKIGKLQTANGGTLFLDEIGELSLGGQTKLLRFLQERVIEPIGSNQTIEVDTRILAATNKDLKAMVDEGKFREDLYYRLNMFECVITPLRHRKEDIPVLIEKFLQNIAKKHNSKRPYDVSPELMNILGQYSWPGNVRELQNTVERLCFLSKDGTLRETDLPNTFNKDKVVNPAIAACAAGAQGALFTLEELEKQHIEKILSIEKNFDKAAEILGITSVTLWRKRKQYGLP